MNRSIDYSKLPEASKVMIFSGFVAVFQKPNPREQISSLLALGLGLAGVLPQGMTFEKLAVASDEERAALDAVFHEAADAVLDVLARHDTHLQPFGPGL